MQKWLLTWVLLLTLVSGCQQESGIYKNTVGYFASFFNDFGLAGSQNIDVSVICDVSTSCNAEKLSYTAKKIASSHVNRPYTLTLRLYSFVNSYENTLLLKSIDIINKSKPEDISFQIDQAATKLPAKQVSYSPKMDIFGALLKVKESFQQKESKHEIVVISLGLARDKGFNMLCLNERTGQQFSEHLVAQKKLFKSLMGIKVTFVGTDVNESIYQMPEMQIPLTERKACLLDLQNIGRYGNPIWQLVIGGAGGQLNWQTGDYQTAMEG